MATGRQDRFLKLERPRSGDAGRVDPLANDERFEGLGDPAGAPVATPPGRATPRPSPPAGADPAPLSRAGDRFRPAPERGLDTAELPDGAQPFTRCARCEVDNSVYARACQNCGADLETVEQRRFNEEHWARRRAEAAAEKAADAARARERERDAAEGQRARRELATEMARRERDRVEDELYREGGGRGRWGSWDHGSGPGEGWGGGSVPPGIRLLRMIPGMGWKIAAVVGAIVVPLTLVLFTRGGPQLAAMLVLLVIGSLFSSGRRRWRRW